MLIVKILLKNLTVTKKDKLVKYYMDGCGHCDDLEPIWKLVESRIKKDHDDSNIIIVQLNANFMENADVPNVEGFPTISMIKGGKKIEHRGARTEEAIMDFFKKHNLLTTQSGGGKRRKQTKKKTKRRSKRRTKRRTKRKHKRSKKGRGGVMSTGRSMLPAKKVKPVSAVIRPVEISNDNYTEAKLNRRGHELINEMRNPRSPWALVSAEEEFKQNKRLFDRKFKNIPTAEKVEEEPKIVGANRVNNSYYNPKTNDGRNDNFTVVSSRRRRGRNTNRIVPISGGKRKKRTTKKNKKGGKWSAKYKKSINCRRPKGFSQKQYCKYGRKHKKKMSGGRSGFDIKSLMEVAGPPTDSTRVPHTNNVNYYDNKGNLKGTTTEGINALIALVNVFDIDGDGHGNGFIDTVIDLRQQGKEDEMKELLNNNGFKGYNDMDKLHSLYSHAKEEANSVKEDVKGLEEELEDEPLTEARIEDLINQKYIVRHNGIIYTVV